MSDLDATRRSISATVNEIVDTEKALLAKGIDFRDDDEWQQLSDIIARIERRLAGQIAA